jgi:3-phenylpropionate/trans-cinnamate dioxygenase ferredoxin reductase component
VPGTFVIIGSGIAGLCAAEVLRQSDPGATIRIVSEEPHPFYSRPGLAYLLRGDIAEKQLRIRPADHLRCFGIDRITARVERLLCKEHEVQLEDGRRLRYDRLLLATGSLAVPPPFPGGDLAGVVKLDSLTDARHILKQAKRGRTAVVVGGGITALELAEGLATRGLNVHYFLRGARYWTDVLDETESGIIQGRLAHEGVTVHTNTQVKQALGGRGRLTGVETQDGTQFPCHLLAVAIGVRPRLELARAAGLKMDRGILVNRYLQTSSPDVFAAGDVAQIQDPATGNTGLDVLWSTALAQGQAAGASMLGAGQPYVKSVPFNVTQLAGLKVTIIGTVGSGRGQDLVSIARGDSETWRERPTAQTVTDRQDVNRIRLLVGERHLLGALVMGDQAWSRPLQRLVASRADINPVRPALLSGADEALAHLAHFYRLWAKQKPS